MCLSENCFFLQSEFPFVFGAKCIEKLRRRFERRYQIIVCKFAAQTNVFFLGRTYENGNEVGAFSGAGSSTNVSGFSQFTDTSTVSAPQLQRSSSPPPTRARNVHVSVSRALVQRRQSQMRFQVHQFTSSPRCWFAGLRGRQTSHNALHLSAGESRRLSELHKSSSRSLMVWLPHRHGYHCITSPLSQRSTNVDCGASSSPSSSPSLSPPPLPHPFILPASALLRCLWMEG